MFAFNMFSFDMFEHFILASLSIYRCWSPPDSSYGGRLAGGLLTTFTGYVPLSEIKKRGITSKKITNSLASVFSLMSHFVLSIKARV